MYNYHYRNESLKNVSIKQTINITITDHTTSVKTSYMNATSFYIYIFFYRANKSCRIII